MMCHEHRSGSNLFGQNIGEYRIESRLGAGSLGIVYRAVNENTGKTVAIKVARDVRETAPRRLLHSAELLARLDHRNVVRVLEVGQYHGATYVVMEFIPGFTLASVLADRGALPWREVVALGLQICDALTYVHDQGVLHRNVKPSHLILDEDERIKLIGFGLAAWADECVGATEGMAVGTPGYMAPEQICGMRTITSGIDLYALGVVFWNLLTGGNPYEEPSNTAERRGSAALSFVHLTLPPPRPSERIQNLPSALDDLVVQLMDHSPQKRPRDAAAVAKILAAAASC
jgi:serine/threonine-protein kinase